MAARDAAKNGLARGHAADGVLLTGATGFIGMELLIRYLERSDSPIYTLVRARSDAQAQARVDRTLRLLFGDERHRGRVFPVRGDITRPDLGLRRDVEALAERVGEIVHGAASVSFALDLPDARAINVEGTRRVLRFAERCHARNGLRRLSYISTAYVGGEHTGCFSEDDLDVGQSFRNAYERSKFEAESLIAARRGVLPVTVLRPSIVVGERGSGWTTSFNVLYAPLKAFSQGAYPAIPARADAKVDVVPVDYVADAVFALSRQPEAEGATFHLTAGEHACSVGDVVQLASDYFGRPQPYLLEPSLYRRVAHPLLLRLLRDERSRRALRRSENLFPYFAAKVVYDNRRCRTALRGHDVRTSPLRSYFGRLVDFALQAQWGRRQVARPQAAMPAAAIATAPAARRRRSPPEGSARVRSADRSRVAAA